jgi:hypothetical protein
MVYVHGTEDVLYRPGHVCYAMQQAYVPASAVAQAGLSGVVPRLQAFLFSGGVGNEVATVLQSGDRSPPGRLGGAWYDKWLSGVSADDERMAQDLLKRDGVRPYWEPRSLSHTYCQLDKAAPCPDWLAASR